MNANHYTMPRRYIPLGNIEEMLEYVAEISDHFMVNAADMMPEAKKQEIWESLLYICENYNDGDFDFDDDLPDPDYQKVLRAIPKECMLLEGAIIK